METEKLYKKACETYGTNAQLEMVVEECAELILAIKKLKRNDRNRKEQVKKFHNFLEELADVEIMLEQMRIIYALSEHKIDSYKKQKLNRLERRLLKE